MATKVPASALALLSFHVLKIDTIGPCYTKTSCFDILHSKQKLKSTVIFF